MPLATTAAVSGAPPGHHIARCAAEVAVMRCQGAVLSGTAWSSGTNGGTCSEVTAGRR